MADNEIAKSEKSGARPLLVGAAGIAVVIAIATAAAQGPKSPVRPEAQPLFEATPSSSGSQVVEDQWIEWTTDDGPKHFQAGDIGIDVAVVRQDDLNAAKVTLSNANGTGGAFEWTGDSDWTGRAKLARVRLDSAQTEPQILISSFSGGAHCCSSLTLVRHEGGRWKRTDLGTWDGDGPALPKDLDGDGKKEFAFVDQSFLYTFAPYAESWAPPVIKAVIGDEVRDVSKQGRFRSVFAEDAARSKEACLQNSNGACAAYVASAARAGSLDEAWTVMLRSYDQASDWILPAACRVRTAGECPAGAELAFATFPEALQWFLGEKGYGPPVYVEPMRGAGPSYDCGGVTSFGEIAVCADPELARLDRTLAVVYSRALALSTDRVSLRSTQLAFLRARNDRAESGDLPALYEGRINQLLAID